MSRSTTPTTPTTPKTWTTEATPTTPDPHATLERFFPAMVADDRAPLCELLTEDIEWHAPPFAAERIGELLASANLEIQMAVR
jgi:hypothetical protein